MEIANKSSFWLALDQTGVLYRGGRTNVTRTFTKVLDELGVSYPAEILSEKYIGTSLAEKFRLWKEDFGLHIPIRPDEFSHRAAELEYTLIDAKRDTDAGLVTFLKEMKAQGITMIVNTASTRNRAERVLEMLGIKGYFMQVCSVEDEGLERVAERLGLRMSDAIIIGDSPFDIAEGKKYGAKTIGYAGESEQQAEALRNAGADNVVRSFAELNHDRLQGFR